MKKRYLAFLISILSIFLIVGCGSEEKASSNKEEKSEFEGVTIKVGQTGWGNLEKGLEAAGLDDLPYKVEYSVFQGGNLILEAMNAGHVDLGITSEIPPIFSYLSQNGENSKVIAISQANTLQQEVVVPEGSAIKTIADLKGKKVGYVQNTTAHYFLIKMLEDAGLTWNDVEALPLTTSDGLAALIGKNIDALASYGNAILSARQNNATSIATAKDILSGDFQINASVQAINDEGKHKAIVDFLQRVNKTYEWQRDNKKEWAEIVATNTKQPVDQALQTLEEGEQQRPSKIISLSEATTDAQQDIADVFKRVGVTQEDIDVNAFWNHDFDKELEEALAK